MREFTMTIGGSAAVARSSYPVENPATGEILAEAPECSHEQLDEAMRAAAVAFASWSSDTGQRRRGLEALAAAVEANLEELAELTTSEQGKPLAEARGELGDVVNDLRYFATLELPEELVRDDQRSAVKVLRRPVGPVAAITPWNFPLDTAVAKIAVGSTTLCGELKHAEPEDDPLPPACTSPRSS